MEWWRIGIYASVTWVLVVAIVAGGLLWYISTHPMGPEADEARVEKAGEVAGLLLGSGLVAIWAYTFLRRKSH